MLLQTISEDYNMLPVSAKLAAEDRLLNRATKLNYLRAQSSNILELENIPRIRIKLHSQMKLCTTISLVLSNTYPSIKQNHWLSFSPFRTYLQLKHPNLLSFSTNSAVRRTLFTGENQNFQVSVGVIEASRGQESS